MVFAISLVITIGFVLWGIIAPTTMATATQTLLSATIAGFGWFYLLTVFGFLLFVAYLAFGPFGKIRLGGDDAKPEFSHASWFAMLFSAGMGIGLVFWGAAEPLSHLAQPPFGEALTADAARMALRYTFFHWGLHPWAIYSVMGLSIAYFSFNRNLPTLLSEAFRPWLGAHVDGAFGQIVDILTIIATACGVATSLGLGTLQIAGGLTHALGLPDSNMLHIVIIIVAMGLALISSLTGVARGIKWLSNLNIALALLLLLAIIVLGPTLFIFESFTTTLGGYIDNLSSMSLQLTPFSKGSWVADWTLFYWGWWITWAPFVGLFIARVSKGRTVREFIGGVLVAPSIVSFIWFSAFGGTAIHQQLLEGINLLAVHNQDYSKTLFAMLDGLPMAKTLSVLALLLITCFFVTSADSANLVLGMLSTRGRQDPPGWIKVVWGIVITAIALVLLFSGGLKALQTLSIVAALPLSLIMVGLCMALYKAMAQDKRAQQREDHSVDRPLICKLDPKQ